MGYDFAVTATTPLTQARWDTRCPDGWSDYPIRTAWREADLVPAFGGSETTARLQLETELVLIAKFGALTTVVPSEWRAGRIEWEAAINSDSSDGDT